MKWLETLLGTKRTTHTRSRSTVKINGRNITVSEGSSVSVVNGVVTVNGQKVADVGNGDVTIDPEEVVIENVSCDGNLTINGTVMGDVEAQGDVRTGTVMGSVQAGGSVNTGTVMGSVRSGKQ